MFSINDRTRRRLNLLLTIAIGVGSISAAAGIFTDPSGELLGIAASLPYLQKIPLIGGIWRSFLPAVYKPPEKPASEPVLLFRTTRPKFFRRCTKHLPQGLMK